MCIIKLNCYTCIYSCLINNALFKNILSDNINYFNIDIQKEKFKHADIFEGTNFV